MPWNRKDYPADWEVVVDQVRKRAGYRCEHLIYNGVRCNAPHGRYIYRNVDCLELWLSEDYIYDCNKEYHRPRIKVVLTTAHICDCRPLCSDPLHLKAWCQLHHLRFDARLHAANARVTRLKKLNMESLFQEGG